MSGSSNGCPDSPFLVDAEAITCKSLQVTHQLVNGLLSGPHQASVSDTNMTVSIEQNGIRTIFADADAECSADQLWDEFIKIEKLFMLFDGEFIPIESLSFQNSKVFSQEVLEQLSMTVRNRRLAYYDSADFCRGNWNCLVDPFSVNLELLVPRWDEILGELDIVHQIFLYYVADNSITCDVKCAFLIELAEPLVALVKKYTCYFATLNPGERGTSLKMCVDNLIARYGNDIFATELNDNYNEFLQNAVNSRIRVMHIKSNFQGNYFVGKQNIAYAIKFQLLYRSVLFEMLGIDHCLYAEKLKMATKHAEQFLL